MARTSAASSSTSTELHRWGEGLRHLALPRKIKEQDMTIAPADRLSGLVAENTQLIGGEWVPAASGETIEVCNPATGETLTHVPRGSAADVDAAVAAATEAFP